MSIKSYRIWFVNFYMANEKKGSILLFPPLTEKVLAMRFELANFLSDRTVLRIPGPTCLTNICFWDCFSDFLCLTQDVLLISILQNSHLHYYTLTGLRLLIWVCIFIWFSKTFSLNSWLHVAHIIYRLGACFVVCDPRRMVLRRQMVFKVSTGNKN